MAAGHTDKQVARAVQVATGGRRSALSPSPINGSVLWKDSPSSARLGPRHLCPATAAAGRPASQQRLDFETAVDTIKSTQDFGVADAVGTESDVQIASFLAQAAQRSQEGSQLPFSQLEGQAAQATQSQCSLLTLSQLGLVGSVSQADDLLASNERLGGGTEPAAADA